MNGEMQDKLRNAASFLRTHPLKFAYFFLCICLLLVLISVSNVGWYHAKGKQACVTDKEIVFDTEFTVSLWEYRSCSVTLIGCELNCTKKEFADVFKVGCGDSVDVGYYDLTIYCFDFDISGRTVGSLLIIGLIFCTSTVVIYLIRNFYFNFKDEIKLKLTIAALGIIISAWILFIACWGLYPIMSDSSGWEESSNEKLHLYWGWYLLMFSLPLMFISILFFIDDYVACSRRINYDVGLVEPDNNF